MDVVVCGLDGIARPAVELRPAAELLDRRHRSRRQLRQHDWLERLEGIDLVNVDRYLGRSGISSTTTASVALFHRGGPIVDRLLSCPL